jgi:hypothetical protein
MNTKVIFAILGVMLVGGLGAWYMLTRPSSSDPIETSPIVETPIEPAEPYVDPYPEDTDRDGMSNEEETALGLDTTTFDTDQDGLADALEINGTNTDPTKADTDGDGLTDGQEFLIWNTDPTKADTDGDGFDDLTEIQNGFNPNGDGRLE